MRSDISYVFAEQFSRLDIQEYNSFLNGSLAGALLQQSISMWDLEAIFFCFLSKK